MSTIITFLAIPMIYAVCMSYLGLIKIMKFSSDISLFFLSGFILYILIHVNKRFRTTVNYVYVFSHELSHAVSGFLSGNSIKKIKVSKRNGYVSFGSRVNKFTAIAPYIFPLYNILISIIYFLLPFEVKKDYFRFFIFTQGLFFSFHIINTVDAISINQTDFKETGGRFVSTVLIILLNLIFFIFLIYIITPVKENILIIFFKDTIKYYIFSIKKIIAFFITIIKYIFAKL
ncbi:MAG: M50 family metallopeptidase [Elusimicrobiales bacterium]|jgi:hypothetical protein|nr:M50 family metallopeptidase [Elusimicrobiales bacterium]